MSLPDRMTHQDGPAPRRWLRRYAVAAAMVLASALTACTVSPLYENRTAQTGFAPQTADKLSLISIEPVKTRVAQQVRNHLIFLLGGGAGQPANPRYVLDLSVSSGAINVATIQLPTENDGRPSAGALQVSASYSLRDIQTDKVITSGSRNVTAAFDRPRQEFAVSRAARDAEDRAAREAAEFVRLALAQELSDQSSNSDNFD